MTSGTLQRVPSKPQPNIVDNTSTQSLPEPDDIELLLRIYDVSNPSDAETAFRRFYDRHATFLHNACRHYRFHHTTIPADAVANHVFAKVFRREIEDFQPEAGAITSEVMIRKVRRWLIEIARFTYYDLRKKALSPLEVFDYDPDAPQEEATVTHPAYESDEPPSPCPPERAAILALRDALSESDRILLDRSLDYFEPRSGDCRVPQKIAQAIAIELGITPAAARQRRKRLFDRLRSQLIEIANAPTP